MSDDIDFYGYQRGNAGTYLFSSDVAAIYFANDAFGPGSAQPARAGLVQNVSASYQHSVLPRFEAGTSELYWVTGQAQGSIGMGRLVSANGLLDGLKPNDDATDSRSGILGSIAIKIGKLENQLRSVQLSQSQLSVRGCVLASYSCTFTTGALEVSEMTAIQVAFMKRIQVGGSTQAGGGAALNGSASGGGIGYAPGGTSVNAVNNNGVHPMTSKRNDFGGALVAVTENAAINAAASGAASVAMNLAGGLTGVINGAVNSVLG